MAVLATSPQGEAIPPGTVWIVVQSSQERREGRRGTERWGRPQGGQIGSGLKSGQHRWPPMSHCAWELAWWVAYIPLFKAVKAVKQGAGLWPGPRLMKLPPALISSGFQPFAEIKAGKVRDPTGQPVAWPREAWIPGQRHSLANSLGAGKGGVSKTSIWRLSTIKTVPPVHKGNVGTQFSKMRDSDFWSFVGI